mgnify:CR=1 FL=1
MLFVKKLGGDGLQQRAGDDFVGGCQSYSSSSALESPDNRVARAAAMLS